MASKYGRIAKREPEVEEQPKIVDRTRAIINVGPDDIAKGIPGDAFHCAFARAATRDIPGAYNVAVTRDSIRVFFGTKHGGYKTYPLNEIISGYVRDFDMTNKCVPFQWEFKL